MESQICWDKIFNWSKNTTLYVKNIQLEKRNRGCTVVVLIIVVFLIKHFAIITPGRVTAASANITRSYKRIHKHGTTDSESSG